MMVFLKKIQSKVEALNDILLILLNQICLHSVFYSLVSLDPLLCLETMVGSFTQNFFLSVARLFACLT